MSFNKTSVLPKMGKPEEEFSKALLAARSARASQVKVRPHRAITPLKVTPWLLAQAIILPILLCGLLIWAKPLLMDFWRDCVLLWSPGLGLPFFRSTELNVDGKFSLILSGAGDATPMPGVTTMAVTAVLTVVAFVLSLGMKNAMLPLKYPIRIVCVVQLATLAYFWLSPNSFPYTIARHSEELMSIGYVVIVATPVMLAMGYYILNASLFAKLAYTALILAFLVVMVPHQVLAQALIMQHLSVLFMPVLYICFGAVFDALVFVALYSWVASNAPPNATV